MFLLDNTSVTDAGYKSGGKNQLLYQEGFKINFDWQRRAWLGLEVLCFGAKINWKLISNILLVIADVGPGLSNMEICTVYWISSSCHLERKRITSCISQLFFKGPENELQSNKSVCCTSIYQKYKMFLNVLLDQADDAETNLCIVK